MPYQHAVTGNIRVPAFLLTVLEQEELRVLGGADHAAHVFRHGLERRREGLGDLTGFQPSQGVALERTVVGRRHAVVVVWAVVHARPCAGRERARITCGVQVGESHHVAELVHERADAVGASALPFVRAAITVYDDAVVHFVAVSGRSQIPGVGPYGVA